MFLKLFKHAFLRNLKTSIVLLSISVAISLLSGISYSLSCNLPDDIYITAIMGSIRSFSSMASYILCIIPVVLTYYSMHKAFATDEAYLTFTLPATTAQHLNSRILSTVCWTLISTAVMVISIVISNAFSWGISIGGSTSTQVEFEEVLIVIEIIILVLSLGLSSILHVVFAIVFHGALAAKMKRRGASIIVVLVLYLEMAILVTLFVLLILVALNGINTDHIIHFLLWTVTVVSLALGALCYFISYKILNRSLNLA